MLAHYIESFVYSDILISDSSVPQVSSLLRRPRTIARPQALFFT